MEKTGKILTMSNLKNFLTSDEFRLYYFPSCSILAFLNISFFLASEIKALLILSCICCFLLTIVVICYRISLLHEHLHRIEQQTLFTSKVMTLIEEMTGEQDENSN